MQGLLFTLMDTIGTFIQVEGVNHVIVDHYYTIFWTPLYLDAATDNYIYYHDVPPAQHLLRTIHTSQITCAVYGKYIPIL